MSTALVLFRRDLRLSDHAALSAACAEHARVLPVYVHHPDEEWGTADIHVKTMHKIKKNVFYQ